MTSRPDEATEKRTVILRPVWISPLTRRGTSWGTENVLVGYAIQEESGYWVIITKDGLDAVYATCRVKIEE